MSTPNNLPDITTSLFHLAADFNRLSEAFSNLSIAGRICGKTVLIANTIMNTATNVARYHKKLEKRPRYKQMMSKRRKKKLYDWAKYLLQPVRYAQPPWALSMRNWLDHCNLKR